MPNNVAEVDNLKIEQRPAFFSSHGRCRVSAATVVTALRREKGRFNLGLMRPSALVSVTGLVVSRRKPLESGVRCAWSGKDLIQKRVL